MGIFSNSSPFDQDVERATSENNTSEEWGLIMEICDRAAASPAAAKECLRAVLRRLAHADPHVQVHAATLLDACVANCGRAFLLEVASRDFEHEFRRLLARAQPAVAARLRALLRKWAEGEFRADPALDLIPSLHAKLGAEGPDPASASAAGPASASAAASAAATAAREQDDLARAIALSLREAGAGPTAATAAAVPGLYPRVETARAGTGTGTGTARRVRALYDFEAAEDNELTFTAGEIVHVTDSSDPNWWKGYNRRGEGLFPANFVSGEEAAAEEEAVAVAGDEEEAGEEEEEEAGGIDEAAMDAALAALHEADPAAPGAARAEAALARLEARALAAGARVDAALERADTRHARLTQLSAELVDALNLYHELMRPAPAPAPPLAPAPLHHFPPQAYAPAPPPQPR